LLVYQIPKALIFESRVLAPLIANADEVLKISWVKRGRIDKSIDDKIIEGYSKIKNNQYVIGVKYDEKGLTMQFVSLSMVNAIYFDWASLETVRLTSLFFGDETQECAVFKLTNGLFEFTIPWDKQFNKLFERIEPNKV
jgi:hypothetical protein